MSGRRKRRVTEESSQAWLLTYGDMVTLLMAFFVMLFAVSTVEQEKFDAFISGLAQFDNPGANPIGNADPIAPVAPSAQPLPQSPATPSAPAPDLEQLGLELLDAVAAAGHPGAVEIGKDPRGLSVAIKTDRVLFDVGSAQLTRTGAEIIAALAGPLRGVDNELLLEGHADNTPLNRNGYTNWNLSTDRAVAVVNALADQHGIAPARLTAAGFGEFRPRDPGNGPEAKARNRRVELIVVADPGSAPPTTLPSTPSAPSTPGPSLEDQVRSELEASIERPADA